MYTHSRPTPRATPTYFTPYTRSGDRDYIPTLGGDRFQSSTVEDLVYGTGRVSTTTREDKGNVNLPPPSPSAFSTMTQASHTSINDGRRREPDDGHGEWVRGKVTSLTREIMEGTDGGGATGFGLATASSPPPPPAPSSSFRRYNTFSSSLPPPPTTVPSGSPMMLKKLRVLQSSCLSSLSRLREIQSSSAVGFGSQASTADPGLALEKVVRDQAYRIAALEEKLERQGEVYGNVLPAQAEYVKELEAAVEGMEKEVSELRAANER